MAESARDVERNRNKEIRLMSENNEFSSANSEKQIEDGDVNALKSLFYLNNLENTCFSKYSVNNENVNRASQFCPVVHGFSSEYKEICPNSDESCRKKRCSDRYDSSESSDSGIAVSSSASSGTSDITDPGSPFSTSSDDSSSSPGKCKVGKRCKSEEKSLSRSKSAERCRSEEKVWTESWEKKQQSNKTDHNFITPETDFKMAPNVPSASSPCDIWTSITETNTANNTAHYNNFNKTQSEAICNKRLKPDAEDSTAPININNNLVVKIPSPVVKEVTDNVTGNKKKVSDNNCEIANEKIKKSSFESVKIVKDTSESSKFNKNSIKSCEKYVINVSRVKQNRNRHQGKITEYFKSQIKSLVGNKRDFSSKKECINTFKGKSLSIISQKAEDPPAKKPKMGVEEKTQLDVPVFVKPSPIQTIMPLAKSTRLVPFSKLSKANFLLKKPSGTKTLFNKILENHKNRKLAESIMKCKTVSKPKLATNEPGVSQQSHKPYESSTRNNVMEKPKTKLEELSSNLNDNKVQNDDLSSNLLHVVSNVSEINNLEVISNRSEVKVSESSKSPILETPTTIRFPATCHNNRPDKLSPPRQTIPCRWHACSVQFDSPSGLLDHLQTAHVLTQVSGEKFVCLWVGCKVFDQKSCSRSWLERHVLSHAGNKPYRCIVDGCGQGFSTQAILERHVNNHFAADVKKALDNSIVHKLFRRNGKKLRYRRQPWSARMFDFFDSGIMEGLEYRLIKLTKARTGGDIADIPGKSLALTSQVIARRMTENGKQQFLLRWFPENIIEDEWVHEKEVTRKKTVSIPNLSPSVSSSLQETLELVARSSQSYRTGRRKNRRVSENKETLAIEEEKPGRVLELGSVSVNEVDGNSSKLIKLSPRKKISSKKFKVNTKKRKINEIDEVLEKEKNEDLNNLNSLPGDNIQVVDITKDGISSTEKIVSLKPKEDVPSMTSLPEEMSVVPVCSSPEEMSSIQTGILVDGSKFVTPVKAEMIVNSPLKVVSSQYIEQPIVQAVMPVQMPVTYQIPIVKLSHTAGVFFPQIPNYIIPPSPPVFSTPSVPAFRNGFHFSTTGTIHIQASSTTLQQTSSTFLQSTNASGFQIVQSPASIQQSILTAFQNSGITSLNFKSPTLRLLNCQPFILNNQKPVANLSMTVTNVSSIANPNTSALTVPTIVMPYESSDSGKKLLPPVVSVSPNATPKKTVKQKLNILPKPNIIQKTGVADGSNNKKQCLQSCGRSVNTAT